MVLCVVSLYIEGFEWGEDCVGGGVNLDVNDVIFDFGFIYFEVFQDVEFFTFVGYMYDLCGVGNVSGLVVVVVKVGCVVGVAFIFSV